MDSVEDLIMKAKVDMLINMPFYATLMHHFRVEKRDEVGTMGVTTSTLYYNEEFVESLSRGELNFIMAHEVMHAALGHHWRRGSRQHEIWNYACDYAINIMIVDHIKEAGLVRMEAPRDVHLSEDYRDMSTEEIYDELIKDAEDSGGSSNDMGTLDNHEIWEEAEPEDEQVTEEEWKGRMISAAKAVGDAPAGVRRLIGQLLNPQKDWRELIAETICTTANDYSFSPPDRRYQDFILPDFNEPDTEANDVLVWIDTSGSVSAEEFHVFVSEVAGAIEQFGGRMNGWMGSFDSETYGPYPFESVEDCEEIPYEGGGGTSFHAVMDKTIELEETHSVGTMVILTDGYASFPEVNPFDFEVVWIMTSDVEPPWGKHAKLTV